MDSTVARIDALAGSGETVMAGADEDILEIVKLTVEANRSVSFYLPEAQGHAFMSWYWTLERVRATGLKLISEEERRRIQSELDLQLDDFHYAPIECQQCSHIYGTFEFKQQGI